DKQVVEQVSDWLLNKYTALDVFTTYYIHYPNGVPEVYPGLESAFELDKGPYGWTVEEQFEHEVLGKGMYYNKTRGTCTSTAVALTTVLRAIGIPTRMIIVIPIVDASNPGQSQLVAQGISNNHVRQVVLGWLSGAGTGFTAHTFNEVYVGNEWHRLNYSKLGQPILDEHCFGLHTHLYTFGDLSDANLAPTWGWRYGKIITSDVFGYYNPYTTMTLLDPNTKTIGPTIYVDDDAPADPGPGDPTISDPCEDGSMLHPFDSIQEAIDASDYRDIVIVQQGTYTGLGNRDIDFRGLAITVRSTNPNNPNVVAATVIDCQGSELEPHRGFYFHNSEDTDSILDGLTITNGYVSDSWPDDSGGGIICYYNSSPTIKNCIVTNNTAEHHGGGIYSYSSSPTLINCMFNVNSAGWNGGGMHNGPSSPNLINCIFTKNTSGSYGGGMSTTSTSSPSLTNCTFSGNSGLNGGAIGVSDSNTLLTNCILWGNSPNEIYVAGGDMPNITYSDVQGGYTGTGNVTDDPCFVDAAGGNLRLEAVSPCIDAGDNTGVPNDVGDLDNDSNTTEPIPWDLDNRTRFADGDCNGTVVVDMGAYEFAWAYLGDFDGQCDVDAGDLGVLCEEWLLEELSCDVWPEGGDGFVDFLDWTVLADGWGDTYDIFDLAEFAGQWLKSGSNYLVTDIAPGSDGDGVTNGVDFAVLAENWLEGM
ncbi:MAG: hypothetical protein JSW23_08440, partial [Planctomycetota bacterium]